MCCTCCMYVHQSQSLYGKILRQLNEFIVNRSRTNKYNESSQYNYNKLAFSIYNYAQLKNLQNDNITGVYEWRLFALYIYARNKSKYNLITIIIIIWTSVCLHLARWCCCLWSTTLSLSDVYLYYGVYTAKCN